ncbi:MAG: hypothetical protein GY757_14225, partial [bacterium]|nr:hypothetical protein [bacterium]
MTTIEVNVGDDMIAIFGREAIKRLMEEELRFQRFRLLEGKIRNGLSEAGVDWDGEFEQCRE